MKDQITNRVQQLRVEIDKSAANHNALLGQLAEAMHMLKLCTEAELNNEVRAEYEDPVTVEPVAA